MVGAIVVAAALLTPQETELKGQLPGIFARSAAQYRALEMNADILLFGHTHVPLVDAASRPMMMNPGSIGDPRRPTYGVLEFKDGQIYPSVFKLETE